MKAVTVYPSRGLASRKTALFAAALSVAAVHSAVAQQDAAPQDAAPQDAAQHVVYGTAPPQLAHPAAPPADAQGSAPPSGPQSSGPGFLEDTSAVSRATAAADDSGKGAQPIRITARLVTVDVVVTDKRGAPVRGLKREDFTVLENGQPQTLKIFEPHSGGGLVLPAVQSAPGTATNAGQEQATPALHAILFDALDTAPSDQAFARSQLQKLIADLPPGSRVALFVLRNDLHMLQSFTTDTSLLLTALQRDRPVPGAFFNDPEAVLLSGVGGSAGASIAEQQAGNVTAGSSTLKNSFLQQNAARDEAALTGGQRIGMTLSALDHLTTYLAALPGRKNLIWVAGTFPVELLPDTSGSGGDLFNDTQTYSSALARMALRMQQGDIAIYPVDAQGFAPNLLFSGANGTRPGTNDIANEFGARFGKFQTMDDIAYQTGGHAIYQDNDLKGAITQALNDGSEYYTLAYTPSGRWDGKYRKLTVRVAGRPVELAYRHGYLAVDPDSKLAAQQSPTKFTTAMLRGAPERAEIVLTVSVEDTGKMDEPALSGRDHPAIKQPHPGHNETYKVRCHIDPKSLQFAELADGARSPRLAVTFLAYDSDGKLLSTAISSFGPNMPQRQYEAVMAKGLTLSEVMQLPLGQVFLRVGVHDMLNEKVGSVELPLIVKGAKS